MPQNYRLKLKRAKATHAYWLPFGKWTVCAMDRSWNRQHCFEFPLSEKHRHTTLDYHAIIHYSVTVVYLLLDKSPIGKHTHKNRAHYCLLSTAPRPALSQQCHSAQRQKPPFCLAHSLKNQSHVQEIHPACISNAQQSIVCVSAADLEGLPIFGALATANKGQVWRLLLTHPWPGWTHTNTHRTAELSRLGWRIHTK